jgi:hypothetical protein
VSTSRPASAAPSLPPLRALCAEAKLDAEAIALLDDRVEPRAFVQLLTDRSAPDAVRLLAHALPVREGVWWAWVSARRAAGETPPPMVAGALAAAEQWIAQPTDANRRTALAHAQADGAAAPSSLVALAAALSGGSLAPTGLPDVPAPPWAAAKAIAGAVIIAAVQDAPAMAERYAAFVEQGLGVADRIGLWERFPAPARGG